jgi:hypothetical protein
MLTLEQALKTTTDVTTGPAQTAIPLPRNAYTPVVVTKRLDIPGGLRKGDVVDLRFREECSNPSDNNNPAQGAYKINGVQSEHWYLWVMVGWQIDRVEPPTVAGGPPVKRRVRHATAMNLDGLMHHFVYEGTEVDIVDRDLATASYELGFYFDGGSSYYPPATATMKIEPGYGKLEALVYRTS